MLRLLSFIFFFIDSNHPCFSKCPRHEIICMLSSTFISGEIKSSYSGFLRSCPFVPANQSLTMHDVIAYQHSLWQVSFFFWLCYVLRLLFYNRFDSILLFSKTYLITSNKCASFDNKSNSTHMSESIEGIGIHFVIYNVSYTLKIKWQGEAIKQ